MPRQLTAHDGLVLLASLTALGVVTTILRLLPDASETTVALALLLVVLGTATVARLAIAIATSLAAVLLFNFFFLPPYGTLTISDPENWVAFGAFVITALIAGQISGYARRRAEESEARQQEIERLYDELRAAFEQASEAEALRRSEKLKSALLDAVTHDLRTPLTSIKASVTTLLEDAKEAMLDRESRGEFLEIIDEETDREAPFADGRDRDERFAAGGENSRRPEGGGPDAGRTAERLRGRGVGGGGAVHACGQRGEVFPCGYASARHRQAT
jgi:two-component system sensor histidine kinase KdpD